MTYFDHNATAPMLPEARAAWLRASEEFIGNPSSPHRIGARAERALQEMRERLAALLGCRVEEIVWTSGATESNNTVLHHFSRKLEPQTTIWISAIEHPSVMESARHLFPLRHQLIPVLRSGVIDLGWMSERLRNAERPGLIAVMAVNNETGVLQPWREAGALAREQGIPFFCDAVQWLGRMPAQGLGECEFISGCAHKLGGPRGIGFLKCPVRERLLPLVHGGPQEEGRRAGTENLPAIVSMIAALETREAAMPEDGPARLKLRRFFEAELLTRVREAEIIGAGADRLWNTVCAVLPAGASRSRSVVKFDKLGFAVSTGSACASGKEKPSHVLAAMGYSAEEAARVVRFSGGWETTEAEWRALAEAAAEIASAGIPSGDK